MEVVAVISFVDLAEYQRFPSNSRSFDTHRVQGRVECVDFGHREGGSFGLKFQFGGGFECDATFFHRETSPALISDFMAKLRPRPSIRRPKEGGALARSPAFPERFH